MSLQVWLPLTKDTRNQGLSNVTITNSNATIDSAGKLGNCYYFNGSNARISCSSKTWDYPLSICGWFKPTDITNSTTQYWLSYNTASGGTAGHAIGIGTYSGKFGIWYGGTQYYSFTQTLSNNVWYHIAVTITSNKIVSTYLNGELIDSRTFSSNNPGSTWFTLGARSNSSTGGVGGALYFYKGYMNDARFYNHCLSPMEIKELAKGLVLHYPLNRRGFGCNNLIPNTHGTYVSGWGAAAGSRAEFRSHSLDCSLPIEVGKTYTLSFDLKMILNTPSSTPYFLVYNTNYKGPHGRWIYQQCNSMLAGTYSVGDIIEKKIIISFTPTSFEAGSYANDNIEFYSTYGTSNWYEVYNLKLEEGSTATPWCPSPSEELAFIVGLNNNIEYDCSGYCNNGTRIGTFNWTGDASKYSVSTVFPSGANYIDADRGAMVTDSITVSLWTKYSTWGNPISCTEGGGWNFENVSSSIRFPVYVASVGYKLAESNIAPSTLVNEWHMITGTFDRTNVKIYIDGELKGTTATGSTNGIAYAGSNAILIGAEASGSHSPASTAFVGNISDVRIYATALSDEDILNLYKQGHHE